MNRVPSAARARGLWLTSIAMLAFASNSILCRLALRGGAIDPASFTGLRLLSGAAVLAPLLLRGQAADVTAVRERPTTWPGALSLFVYAAAFSLAYVRLDAATGALVLFGSVQLTMVVAGLLQGQRLSPRQWQGMALSVLGLLGLTLPGVGAVDPIGAGMMAASGVAWGVYSLRGRHAGDASTSTARNFLHALPLAALLLVIGDLPDASATGIALSLASGVLASGIGYVIWYAALPQLLPVEAALVQLSVPIIAAVGSALLIREPLTVHVVAAGTAILLGIGWAVTARRPAAVSD